MVFQHIFSGTTYVCAVRSGVRGWVLVDYGTVASTVINSALGALTAGRTWKEKVVVMGNSTINASLTPGSYTILELQGKVTLANNANVNMINVSAKTNIEILGGEWNGNRANQTADLNGFDFTSCTYIIVDNVIVHDVKETVSKGIGINFYMGNHNKVLNCTAYNCGDVAIDAGGMGIDFNGESQGLTAFNEVHDCNGGIYLGASANLTTREFRVIGNYVKDVHRDGIAIYPYTATSYLYQIDVIGNIIVDPSRDGAHAGIKFGYSSYVTMNCVVSDNIISETGVGNYATGISIASGTSQGVVSGNIIENTYQTAIILSGSQNIVNDNKINTVRGTGFGIRVAGNYNNIVGNSIYNVTGSWAITFYSPASYNLIDSNVLDTMPVNGINIQAGCIGNIIGHNPMFNMGGTYLLDNGTGTILPTLVLPFVDGTLFLSADGAPWGWEIDADTEYAIAHGWLPLEVQKVVRWKVWAVSLVTEVDKMRLEIVGRGGADNQAYTTESVDIANKPSTSVNFSANDYIYWTLTPTDDASIGLLTGADAIMIKVKHEAAGDGDWATDAAFLCVEIEYV